MKTLVEKGEIVIRSVLAEYRLEHLTQLDEKRLLALLHCNKTEEQRSIGKSFTGVGNNVLLLVGNPEATRDGIDEEVKEERIL